VTSTTVKAEIIRRPLMSGHCAHGGINPKTGVDGHERCHLNGGGQRANPLKEFQPCPCSCHYVDDRGELIVFECGECGRDIVEAPLWPLDEEGEVRYTHIDSDSKATGEDCDTMGAQRKPKAGHREEDPIKDCARCGSEYRGSGRGRLCPDCIAADEAEEDDFSDLDFEDEDDFADLDDL